MQSDAGTAGGGFPSPEDQEARAVQIRHRGDGGGKEFGGGMRIRKTTGRPIDGQQSAAAYGTSDTGDG